MPALRRVFSWDFSEFVAKFHYEEDELTLWSNPRYVIRGDKAYRLYDENNKENGPEKIGTWSVWDTENDMYLAHITSGGSRLMAQMMADSLNNGTYWKNE